MARSILDAELVTIADADTCPDRAARATTAVLREFLRTLRRWAGPPGHFFYRRGESA